MHSSIQKKESEFILKKIKKELLIQKNILSKKIRIGFISADFNNHAVSFQLKNFFILLSKNSETEIFFYYNSGKKDEINLELQKLY